MEEVQKPSTSGVFTYVKSKVKGGTLTGAVPTVQLDRQQFLHSGVGGGRRSNDHVSVANGAITNLATPV
jgi:hypothetical protein